MEWARRQKLTPARCLDLLVAFGRRHGRDRDQVDRHALRQMMSPAHL